jgi:dTDP-4-dehydrorhamnose reductase
VNEADLTNEKQLRKLIQKIKPKLIINAAAYTAVDHAEHDEVEAFKVNARGPQIIGEEATTVGATVIHYSTDYVFDGKKKSPYKEKDKTNPLSVYGSSKLQGEKLLMAACYRSIILRTSWVVSEHGDNFLKKILNFAKEKDISAKLLASLTQKIAKEYILKEGRDVPYGIYHVTASGKTNWFAYAKLVLTEAIKLGDTFRVTPDLVLATTSDKYPTIAKRPLNSLLNTELFKETFNMTLPSWEEDVLEIIKTQHKSS